MTVHASPQDKTQPWTTFFEDGIDCVITFIYTKMLSMCDTTLDRTYLVHPCSSAFLFILLILSVGFVVWIWCFQRSKCDKTIASYEEASSSYSRRFRKRDRIAFMGKKALRKAKAMGSLIRGGQGRRRKAVARLVRRVFRGDSPRASEDKSLRPNLPEEYLDFEEEEVGGNVPTALLIVLKNLRVFGQLNNKIFVELMKSIEYIQLRSNTYLFKVGDPDDHMYIVESGRINLFSGTENSQSAQLIKSVGPGETLFSLLSFVGHMGGREEAFKTVSARAVEETKIIKLNFVAFKETFRKYPEHLSKVVRVIMIRLQRVTLLTLHQYLGLGAELLTQKNRGLDPNASREKVVREINQVELQKAAINSFLEELELKAEDLEVIEAKTSDNIQDYLTVTSWEEGDVLVEEDSSDQPCLLLVLQGCVSLTQMNVESKSQDEIHRVYSGGIICHLQALTGEPSYYTATAMTDTDVAALDMRFIRRCMDVFPRVAVRLGLCVIDQLSPYVRSIDFSLEWLQLESGHPLYKQGEEADSTFVVLSGRLRSVIKKGQKRELVGEYARGELTGIVETLMKTPRSTTVLAVRDTEVAIVPSGLIDMIKVRYPTVLLRLIKMLGEKLQQTWERGAGGDAHSSSFSTVAVISIFPHLPVSAFTLELLHALNQIDPSIRLTRDYVLEELGDDALDKVNDFKLSSWLTSQEDQHCSVLYQCESGLTDWTRLCLRHADVIFILTDIKFDASITLLERNMENMFRRTRKEMIFLHDEDTRYPKGTANWLKDRGWINAHYHVKCPRRMYSRKTRYSKILQGPPPAIHSDFSRLARMITGQSVGLVLGGGGARGCAHIGMIKAILEAGIPVDHVAGVSIGSFIGGLYSKERDLTEVTVKARHFCTKIGQVWRWILDLTNPHTSYFTGYHFNWVVESLFESDHDIRDNWLPYFCITTDITDSCMRIHDYGSLWRYVRASMTLAGWLPPICDPHDGHLLLDGGYANNLPADIMRQRGAKHIMAVDVGAEDNMNFSNYGDTLSGFKILMSKLNPFATPIHVPNQAEVQLRLAYVSCTDKLESVKNSGYCEYIRPPIEKYGTLQFKDFDEIKEVGYRHGETFFKGFKKAGMMRQFYWSSAPTNLGAVRRRRHSLTFFSGCPSLASSLESGGASPMNKQHFSDLSSGPEILFAPGDISSPVLGAEDQIQRKSNQNSFQASNLFTGFEGDTDDTEYSVPSKKEFSTPDAITSAVFPNDVDDIIDSDQLISDEENDDKPGFLCQM